MQRPDIVEQPEPGIRRVLAANPSPMTYWGTNTYIVGTGSVAIIDPGPADSNHFQAIFEALVPGETVSHVFVTHSHLDHSPLARPLAEKTGAIILAYGDSQAGRSEIMKKLSVDGLVRGGEGVDPDFHPDEALSEGDEVSSGDWSIKAVHTPGHFGNHMCFSWKDALFSGDHVMDWASSLVSPPDGDLTDFMHSTQALHKREDRIFYPGHGAPVTDPKSRTAWLLAHRQSREKEILDLLALGPKTARQLTQTMYSDISANLHLAAERNVLAHLIDLAKKTTVESQTALSADAVFQC